MRPEDAVKALEGLERVATLQLLQMQPGDVLVVTTDRELDEPEYDSLTALLRRVLPPGCPHLVLDRGLAVQVLRAPEQLSGAGASALDRLAVEVKRRQQRERIE